MAVGRGAGGVSIGDHVRAMLVGLFPVGGMGIRRVTAETRGIFSPFVIIPMAWRAFRSGMKQGVLTMTFIITPSLSLRFIEGLIQCFVRKRGMTAEAIIAVLFDGQVCPMA